MTIKARSYDYIIAGGGTAGSALAARLAEDPDAKILLLEAGGKGRDFFITMPAGNGFIFGNPKYDWGFDTVPQEGLGGRRIYYPRGKALGGSTIMNGMIYMRGNRMDYDGWRQMGLKGWGYSDVLPYFKRSEGASERRSAYHGADGPLKTCSCGNYDRIDALFAEAALQAGEPANDDFNGPRQVGVGKIDVMVSNGRRQSAARAYLRSKPANLEVRTGAQVLSLVMEKSRARAVRIKRGNNIETLFAEREIILSLGTFASPQTLMLSGLGSCRPSKIHGHQTRHRFARCRPGAARSFEYAAAVFLPGQKPILCTLSAL